MAPRPELTPNSAFVLSLTGFTAVRLVGEDDGDTGEGRPLAATVAREHITPGAEEPTDRSQAPAGRRSRELRVGNSFLTHGPRFR